MKKYTVTNFRDVNEEFNRPSGAIKSWFALSTKYPTQVCIIPINEEASMELLEWASYHPDAIGTWHLRSKCPYKLDYILNSINRQIGRGYSNIKFYPDQLDPFSVG